MKNTRIIIFGIIAWSVSSCQSRSSAREGSDSTRDSLGSIPASSQIPLKYRSYFKLGDQNKFSFTFNDIEKLKLVKIDSLPLIDLLEGDELLRYNKADFEHYFYSYQAPKLGYQAVTVLLNIEYSYIIYYLIFSLDGKLLSKFEVAREGGDGASTREYGYFANDTTYLKTRISVESVESKGTKIDSVQRRIVFNRNGKVVYSDR
jgi:hypothetical protein